MKKQYVTPESLVVELQNEGVLSSSYIPVKPGGEPEESAAPSRRQNAWDEYRNN